MVKNIPVMREVQVQSLGQEDPLEKGMVPHSSILAWRILWPEKPGGSMGSQIIRHYRETKMHTHTIPLPPLHSNPDVPTLGEGC